eukprot:SAG22_NODE_10547_length_528_cov_1.324009_2_plen_60_part_00
MAAEALLEGQKLLASKGGMDVYQERIAKASMAVLYPILWNWENAVSPQRPVLLCLLRLV